MKILIIEDDQDTLEFLSDNLKQDLFIVDTANNGLDGSFMARTNPYDVIILDYSLPRKNGFSVCQELRSANIRTPILFLTIHSELKKKVESLNAGADDYMIKPFSLDELRARIYALARRPHKIENMILSAGDLIINTQKQTVNRGSSSIYLTRKEYTLLEYLVRNKNTVLSRGMIMEHVWNADSDPFSNTIEAHILNLRKKIQCKKNKEIIRNVPGRGYIIDTD